MVKCGAWNQRQQENLPNSDAWLSLTDLGHVSLLSYVGKGAEAQFRQDVPDNDRFIIIFK